MSAGHLDLVCETYNRRAEGYDEGNKSWHVALAKDIVRWLEPQPGEVCLDLGCGTGLVTMLLAQAVGPTGKVVGVDLTTAMIEQGKKKVRAVEEAGHHSRMAEITWINHDITNADLLEQPAVKQVLDKRGGFDTISLTTVFVLLQNVKEALSVWKEKLLKKGGRIIVDVSIEHVDLQFLMNYHLLAAIGLPDSLSKCRLAITGKHTLEDLFTEVGLKILQSFKVPSYFDEEWYDEKAGLDVLENELNTKHKWIVEKAKGDEARKAWPKVWQEHSITRSDGSRGFDNAHPLYVVIGTK